MKSEKLFIDSDNLDWEQVNENISIKVLNGQADEGPYTAILRSKPRRPDPHRGQYHPVDEEFYCLGGRFTFDGTNWFRTGSYVHFPANYVHGARVHVEDGYLLYLRISGTSQINIVEEPKSTSPYLRDGASSELKSTVHRRVSMAGKSAHCHRVNWLKSRLLKENPRTREGTTVLQFEPGSFDQRVVLSSANELELFVISGTFENETGTNLVPRAYSFLTGKSVEIALCAKTAGKILVSHGAELSVSVT